MLLVGSEALNSWCKNIGRTPSDLDYICTIEEYDESFVTKFHTALASGLILKHNDNTNS